MPSSAARTLAIPVARMRVNGYCQRVSIFYEGVESGDREKKDVFLAERFLLYIYKVYLRIPLLKLCL